MATLTRIIDCFDGAAKRGSIIGVFILFIIMMLAPLSSGASGGLVSGTIYNSNGYPVGDSKVELYSYVYVDTPWALTPLQSDNLVQTQRTWMCPTSLDLRPLGIPASSSKFADSAPTTIRPPNLATLNNHHYSDAIGYNSPFFGIPSSTPQIGDSSLTTTMPAGSAPINAQDADSSVSYVYPFGTPFINSQDSNSIASNSVPLGSSASLSSQIGDTVSTSTQPTGSVPITSQGADTGEVNIGPLGSQSISSQTSNSTATNSQPTGSAAVSSQSDDSSYSDSQPSGSVSINSQGSDTSSTNSQPSQTPAINSQNSDSSATNTQPSGTALISSQSNNSFAMDVQPGGSTAINSQNSNSSAVNLEPTGAPSIASQISNSSATNSPPTGSAAVAAQTINSTFTNSKPSGLSEPANLTSVAAMTLTQPTGAITITINSKDAITNATNPGNAPVSISGTWYTGNFTIESGDDGDGIAEDKIYWVLTDTAVSGVYNIMNLSYDPSNFNEGDTADQFVGAGDDEGISDGEVVILGTYRFTVNFESDPSSASPDAWLTSSEWYTGSFNIDVNGDGTIGGGEYVNYTLSDSDSDGIYDTLDLSSDDTTFGEGTLDDGQTGSDDDEQVDIFGTDVTYETYLFTTYFWENPNSSSPDAALRSKQWYDGSFTIDIDADGAADDLVYFVLSDMNSDGLYDTMDISLDTIFNEGTLNDGNVTVSNDEQITATDNLILGDYLEFEVDFDPAPTSDSDDARITSNEWYEGTFTIDGDGDGAVESDNVYYVLTDTDSDGLYDTMDISMGDQTYGEGNTGDLTVDFNASDNTNDEQILATADIILGDYFLFTVEFDSTPNMDSEDAKITIKEWYEGTFTIDADGDGVADNTIYFILTDFDSDGIYDVMDISIGDQTYREGNLDDLLVDYDASDNSNDENLTAATTITLGSFNFTVEFDASPNTDANDASITSELWYVGAFSIDSDSDGFTDDTLYYVLSDTNSNGTYYTMELSFDTTFGEGVQSDSIVNSGNDELITSSEFLTLGDEIEFEVDFDFAPLLNSDDARITSNEWYEGTFTIDADGDGTVESGNVYYVLSDSNSDGTYDTMDISIGDEVYMEGDEVDFVVDFSISNNTDDEQIISTADITLGSYFLFTIEFDITPNMDSDDARITIKEWYEGAFTIDADGDGASDNFVYFVLSDTDSDGIYDTMDISIGDEVYLEGDVGDMFVDFSIANNTNDEEITISTNMTLGSYNFTVEFDFAPNLDGEDARISSAMWFEGFFTIDSDDDGVSDDFIYYALSDKSSQGIYDTLDISLDPTFGEDPLTEGNVTWGNDEQITSSELLILGDSLEFEVDFDVSPSFDSDDARITSNEWYEGTFTIDGNGDGTIEANNVYYVLSDIGSDGVYDTMDISMGDQNYGEVDTGDLIVDFSTFNNTNDEQIASSSDVILGDFLLFTLEFDGGPNIDSNDARITIKEWYTGTFTIDADSDGSSDDVVNFVLTDSDSDGLYDTMDISIGDTDFGEDSQNDYYVDFYALDNTNDERTTGTKSMVLGIYNFTVEFDNNPNFDSDDARITSNIWYEGSFTIDADSDGILDDVFYFVLSDPDSDGTFDTMDLSVNSTYGEIPLGNTFVDSADDERISTAASLNLGNTLLFMVEFDENPEADVDDVRLRSNEWYKGVFSIDANGDGIIESDGLHYVISDTDSDGIYDTMDISLGDEFYGEGNFTNSIVDFSLTNNTDDERINSQSNITLGDYFLFTVDFDPLPNSDPIDAQITMIQWYEGNFVIDADGDGASDNNVYFALTDTDSNGLYDVMDISIGDTVFGEGNITDLLVDFDDLNNTNDERITSSTNVTLGGFFPFSVDFDSAPNSDSEDAVISILMWFEASFVIDADSDEVADDTVYLVISDSDSNSLYDVMDISIEDAQFGETAGGTLSDEVVNITGTGNNDNDERIFSDAQITLGNTLLFNISFSATPPTGIDDITILIYEWFLGSFEMDADDKADDGKVDDNAYYVLTDLDSDGVYDIMDLSVNDLEFGETITGTLSDKIVDYSTDADNRNDERITETSNLSISDLNQFTVEFDGNPGSSDGRDASLLSITWYTGAFSIDVDGDGIVDPDGMKFVLTDGWANGTYVYFMEISTDDDQFGEAPFGDFLTGFDNDERINEPANVTLGFNRYFIQHFDGLHDGFDVNDGLNINANDVKIISVQWNFGTAFVEGLLKGAVTIDTDSDGVFEEVYIDLNNDGDYEDVGVDAIALKPSDTIQSPNLQLDYTLLSIHPNGRSFEITPVGASVGLTANWFFGEIEAPAGSANRYIVLLSDSDGDAVYDTADFETDIPTDGLVDAIGLTETSGLVYLGGTQYQIVSIEDSGAFVRITAFIDVVLGSNNDISLSNSISYGLISEADLVINLNRDGDMTDTYHTLLLDNNIPGDYETVFIDTNDDDDLSDEMALAVGDSFTIMASLPMEAHDFEIDLVDSAGDYYRFKQTNHPVASFITDSNGYYELNAQVDGYYWTVVSNSDPLWGYETLYDTNSESGVYVANGNVVGDQNYYLVQRGNFIFGYVNDSQTLSPLANAMVEIYDPLGNLVVSTQTKSDGSYQIAVMPGVEYDMVYTLAGYHTDDGRVAGSWWDLLISSDTYYVNVWLDPDTQSPEVSINSPYSGETVSGTFDITVTATDDHLLETVEVSFDQGVSFSDMSFVSGDTYTFSWDTTFQSDGTQRILVKAVDFAGNSQTDYIDCYVTNDVEAPSVMISSPIDLEYIDGIHMIRISASDNNALEFVNITLDTIPYETTYNPSSGYYELQIDTTSLSDGLHSLSAKATDYAQNTATDSLSSGFYSDNNAPTLVIYSPIQYELVWGPLVFLDVDSEDQGSFVPTVQYKIDNGAWITLPGEEILGWAVSWDSNSVSNGIHSISFQSYDDFGHMVSESITITVDNDDPAVSLVSPLPGEYVKGTHTFKVQAEDEIEITNVFISIDSTDYATAYNTASGLWEVTLDSTLIFDGTYALSATAEDKIPAHSQTTSSYNFYIDNNAPTLSIYLPKNNDLVWGSSVSIEVNSTDPGTSQPTVQYKIDSSAWIMLFGSESVGWVGSWDTTSVSNGPHSVTARAYDDAGYLVAESISILVDNDKPQIVMMAPVSDEYIMGTYTFSALATDDVVVSSVKLTISGSEYATSYNTASGMWELSLDTTTFSDGTYSIFATVEDQIPGHTQSTASINFNIDNTQPTLEIIFPQNNEFVSGAGQSIEVNSEDPGTFVPTVEYKIDNGMWNILSGSEILGWTGSWDSNSVSNGAHTIYFRSYDDAGHVATDSLSVTVDNDNPQVSVIKPLSSEYLKGAYTFCVFAQDEVGIKNVFITINFVNYITSLNSASGFWEVSLDTTIFPDGSYTISATCEDEIPSHMQTTSAVNFNIDNNAPSLSIISPIEGETIYGTAVTIGADSQDPGPGDPIVEYRIDSGLWNVFTGSEIIGWTDSWDSETVSSGAHTISFRSYDGIGNIVSDQITITVDNENPQAIIVSPSENEFVEGTYNFRVLASDDIMVTEVYLTLNGIDYYASYNSVSGYWEVPIDTSMLNDGTYLISATVSDAIAGHTQTTATFDFNVDNSPPELFINYPVEGEYIRGIVSFNVLGSDIFIDLVQYNVDGTGWVANTTALNTVFWADGPHTISFRASDLAGHYVYETLTAFVDNKDTDSDGIGDLEDPDIDDDGVENENDLFPYDNSEWQDWDSDGIGDNSDLDDDNDGVTDSEDDFPLNQNEWLDSDADGIGDNSDYDDDDDGVFDASDAFPNDPLEWMDTDSDGEGNNADLDDDNDGSSDSDDMYPTNPNEHTDSDLDGVGDNADSDDDNDGISDELDAFPYDPLEWRDTDSDGIGNNADLDDDGDGVSDLADDFPLNPNEYIDSDLDGVGDSSDLDDDGDGWVDELDSFPQNSQEWLDTDSDGIGNNADSDDDGDGVSDSQDDYPLNPNEYKDSDSDGIADGLDDDIDGDGYVNINDAFPYNPGEWSDFDSDGIGDRNDTDIDGDGVANALDDFDFTPTESIDSDSDGTGDNADSDDDGDGVPDANDAFPLNPAEFKDTDSDGIGDNSDPDIDNDGFPNSEDDFPQLASEWRDFDSDGVGDNSDSDDDNDGVVDREDYYPYNKNEHLDPFWWWWILISVLVVLLTFVIFITNRSPKDYLGPEEHYERPSSLKISRKPKKTEALPKVKTSETYSKEEVIEPKIEQTYPVSEITPSATETDVSSFEEEQYSMKAEEIECPACGMTFMVEIDGLPTEIKCPYCGVTGALD